MSSRNFIQLSLEQRAQLLSYSLSKLSATEVANKLQVSRQTIYRELRRNTQIIPAKNNPTCKYDCLNTGECFNGKSQKFWFCKPNCLDYNLRNFLLKNLLILFKCGKMMLTRLLIHLFINKDISIYNLSKMKRRRLWW